MHNHGTRLGVCRHGSLRVPWPATTRRGSGGTVGGREWARRRVRQAAYDARYKWGYVQWLKAMYKGAKERQERRETWTGEAE